LIKIMAFLSMTIVINTLPTIEREYIGEEIKGQIFKDEEGTTFYPSYREVLIKNKKPGYELSLNLAPKTTKASKIPFFKKIHLFDREKDISEYFKDLSNKSKIPPNMDYLTFNREYLILYKILKNRKRNTRVLFEKGLVTDVSELYSYEKPQEGKEDGVFYQTGIFLIHLNEKKVLQVKFTICYALDDERFAKYKFTYSGHNKNEIETLIEKNTKSKKARYILKFDNETNDIEMFGKKFFAMFGLDWNRLNSEKVSEFRKLMNDFNSESKKDKEEFPIEFEFNHSPNLVQALQSTFVDFQTEKTEKKSSPKVKKRSTNWFSGKSKDKGEEQSLLSSEESDDEWDQEMVGASKIRRI